MNVQGADILRIAAAANLTCPEQGYRNVDAPILIVRFCWSLVKRNWKVTPLPSLSILI